VSDVKAKPLFLCMDEGCAPTTKQLLEATLVVEEAGDHFIIWKSPYDANGTRMNAPTLSALKAKILNNWG
jgi:hypothetical protein